LPKRDASLEFSLKHDTVEAVLTLAKPLFAAARNSPVEGAVP
jgi:hypothetical protein